MTVPADEVWKVVICARDISKAEQAAATVAYICRGGFGTGALQSDLETIRDLTGAQIADAIQCHIDDRLSSVQAAIQKEPA